MTAQAVRANTPSKLSNSTSATAYVPVTESTVGSMHERIVRAFDVSADLSSPTSEAAIRSFYQHAPSQPAPGAALRLVAIAIAASAMCVALYGVIAFVF